ncbi:MAG: ABC transporter substrate-binding protein, partial [Candidatus Limnocylindrales bacterium]
MTSPPSATPVATATDVPAPATADRIRIGIVSPFERVGGRIGTSPFPLSNVVAHAWDIESMPVARFLFRALYQYDSLLSPVPDLASEPCRVTSGLLEVTCKIGAATFSDGHELTAADVVFTYEVAMTPACPFGQYSGCLIDSVASVEAIDTMTVRFTLPEPSPSFVTVTLPTLWIESEPLVRAQYDAFRVTAEAVGAEPLREAAEALESALDEAVDTDCEALRGDAEALIETAGIDLPDKALWQIGPGRSFDTCGWTALLKDTLFNAADSLDVTGMESIARAYPILPLNWHPVGTGLWVIDDDETLLGSRVVLTPSPTADRRPATPRFEFVSYPTRRDAAEGYRVGDIDWLHIPADWGGGVEQGGADLFHLVESFDDVTFAEYADPTGFMELGFNVRQGQLFSDPNLRQALRQCLDLGGLV